MFKEYLVRYRADNNQLRTLTVATNKKKALKEARYLIEKEVFIDVYQVKKVARIPIGKKVPASQKSVWNKLVNRK